MSFLISFRDKSQITNDMNDDIEKEVLDEETKSVVFPAAWVASVRPEWFSGLFYQRN